MTTWLSSAALLGALLIVGSAQAQQKGAPKAEAKTPQKRQLPWEKNNGRIGQALYRENCIVCHDIEIPYEKSIKQGPSLFKIFEQDSFPESGSPVTRDYIKSMIRFGNGGLMPSFQKRMTAAEMEQLLDYIQSK